jgi:hypothetical protein
MRISKSKLGTVCVVYFVFALMSQSMPLVTAGLVLGGGWCS